MKLGVLTVILGDLTLDETLKYLKGLGVQAVEIGCGGSPGTAHANAVEFMKNPALIDSFMETIKKYDMQISCLSVHGNAVHPNPDIAAWDHQQFEAAVLLAEKIGVDRVTTFSGCPGDHEGAKYPNWVTCTWPTDYQKILQWQWEEKLIPYWSKEAKFAADHGVKVCFELHPGFCVYNPRTMLKIREACGTNLGANFDPSHLFWQGIDPVMAIRELKGAIYHFHAKDTYIDPARTAINGVLDTTRFDQMNERSWLFRTVGYGHGEDTWRAICSELRNTGYDYVMSIEHEDGLMTPKEGLEKAIAFLKRVMIFEEQNSNMYWA